MEKTKLGISVGLFASAIFATALMGSFTPTIILVGYVLLIEEDEWLKKMAIKAFALLVCFGMLSYLIQMVPDVISWFSSLLGLINVSFHMSFLVSVCSVISKAVYIVMDFVFLILIFSAVNKNTVKLPIVDKLVDKCFE